MIKVIKELINEIIKFLAKLLNAQDENNKQETKQENLYKAKNLMTKNELVFYNKLKELEYEYKIVPQLNLGTVIQKTTKGYRNELFKNIDFAIFSNDFSKLLLLVELNDSTHKQSKRRKRDKRVKEICSKANIKLITFYTTYPNEKEYVVNRIKQEIKKEKEPII